MNRLGSATGNGAGCETRRADSGGISHTDSVAARNSSRAIVLTPLRARLHRSLLKQRQYSCKSRNVGLLADRQLPHAHDPEAPLAFTQMTSPRGRNLRSSMIAVTWSASDTYGRRPWLATFTTALPPGSRTL